MTVFDDVLVTLSMEELIELEMMIEMADLFGKRIRINNNCPDKGRIKVRGLEGTIVGRSANGPDWVLVALDLCYKVSIKKTWFDIIEGDIMTDSIHKHQGVQVDEKTQGSVEGHVENMHHDRHFVSSLNYVELEDNVGNNQESLVDRHVVNDGRVALVLEEDGHFLTIQYDDCERIVLKEDVTLIQGTISPSKEDSPTEIPKPLLGKQVARNGKKGVVLEETEDTLLIEFEDHASYHFKDEVTVVGDVVCKSPQDSLAELQKLCANNIDIIISKDSYQIWDTDGDDTYEMDNVEDVMKAIDCLNELKKWRQ